MIGANCNEKNINKIHLCDFGLAKYYMVPKQEEESKQQKNV